MILQIPEGEFEGFIFDCDGTLADTMPMHYRAWVHALSPHGVDFPESVFYHLGGTRTPTIVEILNQRHGKQMPVDEVVHEKEIAFRKLLPEVRPIQCVVDFALEKAGRFPLSVASGGLRTLVEETLTMLGLLHLFPTVVAAEDVAQGKPDPTIFLLAAHRMGVEPTRCLVFEDAPPGVQAARNAGMACVIVPSSPVELDHG